MRTSAVLQCNAVPALRALVGTAAAVLVFTFGADAALAQQPAPAAAAYDAKAIDALSAMGEYLRSLKSFAIHADTAIDDVLTTGQKLQFAGTRDYRVQTPNRLHAEVNTDRHHREFFCGGKSLTQYAPRMNHYASIPAPGVVSPPG